MHPVQPAGTETNPQRFGLNLRSDKVLNVHLIGGYTVLTLSRNFRVLHVPVNKFLPGERIARNSKILSGEVHRSVAYTSSSGSCRGFCVSGSHNRRNGCTSDDEREGEQSASLTLYSFLTCH